ncbi:MAG: SDR family NAD(P)-dependent oxidoreductase [Caldithrix sp.]|nr:SDR family NAD(P)-dependent oxidoreductase [Caldithrix sp.]
MYYKTMRFAVQGNVVLITGSTDGIGKLVAMEMAKMNATVIIHGRDEKRGKQVLSEIKKTTGNDRLDFALADLSSQSQIVRLADHVCRTYHRLDILINNAGVFRKKKYLTEDGYELTFAVNHLAPFLLTGLLLDLLMDSSIGRIVNVSSMTHASTIDFENLHGEKSFSGTEAYALSKLCNLLFTYELADKLKGNSTTVNALHPGVIDTKLLREGWGGIGNPIEEGADNVLYLANDKSLEKVTGKYFVHKKESNSSEISYSPEARKRLWEESERMTGFDYESIVE